MNKNKNKKQDLEELINPEFADLFSYSSIEEELDSDARKINNRFLSVIEKLYGTERGMKKKLAEGTGLSTSYITQLFNGDKLVNLNFLAKVQKIFDFEFEVNAKLNNPSDYVNSAIGERHRPAFIEYNIFITNNEHKKVFSQTIPVEEINSDSKCHFTGELIPNQ